MQGVMPPFLRYELGNQNGYPEIHFLGLMLHGIDELRQRLDNAPVLGIQRNQPNFRVPLVPFLLKLLFRLFIERHIYSDDLIRRQRFRVIQRIFHYMRNSRYGNYHDIPLDR